MAAAVYTVSCGLAGYTAFDADAGSSVEPWFPHSRRKTTDADASENAAILNTSSQPWPVV